MAKKIDEKILTFNVVFEEAPEGGYVVSVPSLPGCVTEGDTFEQAKENAQEAITAYLGSLAKDGEKIVPARPAILGTVDVSWQNYNFA